MELDYAKCDEYDPNFSRKTNLIVLSFHMTTEGEMGQQTAGDCDSVKIKASVFDFLLFVTTPETLTTTVLQT